MVIRKDIIINVSIEKAWEVLGHQFSNPSQWASAVRHSEGRGASFDGASCSERGCSTTIGEIREKLTHYSDEDHSLAYEVAEGMPSFVKYATNSWKLTELDADKTCLEIHVVIQTSGLIGAIMQPFMNIQMSRFGKEALEDLKYYLEQGVPHPRKVKANNKLNAAVS